MGQRRINESEIEIKMTQIQSTIIITLTGTAS
jgi:hypothetical protein